MIFSELVLATEVSITVDSAENDGATGIACMTRRLHRLVYGLLLLPLGICGQSAWAQRAEPPLPHASGDFLSSQTQGNRGLYEVRHWLLIEPDPEGTHCRSLATHQPIARLRYGDLVVTDTPEHGLQQAVVVVNGRPWLRVRLPGWRLLDVAQRSQSSVACLVRANAGFIAPVNGSDLIEIEERARRRPR